jgi:putative ABC transport system permease protein
VPELVSRPTALWQDLRYGARALRQSRGHAAATVLTLVVGVGIGGAAFSVADSVLFRPLPFPRSDRLVLVHEATPSVPDMSVAYPNFLDWKQQSRSFTAIGAFRRLSMNLTAGGAAERVAALMASADLFRALETPPLYGRGLNAGDDHPGAPPVAVLDHRYWSGRFHADPAVLGTTVSVEGRSFVVVGVMPASFRLPTLEGDLWLPIGQWADGEEMRDRGNHPDILVLGRLAPGATPQSARAELAGIASRLEAQYPSTNRRHKVVLEGWQQSLVAPVRRVLLIVLAAALLVLLMAWVNVGSLMAAHALGRRGELVARAALGASRGRLVRQLVLEGVLVACLGLAIGLPIAAAGVRALAALTTARLPRIEAVAVDLRTIGAVSAVTVLLGLALTLAPALNAVRGDLAREFAVAGQGALARRGQRRLRSLLIVQEIALALVVLAGAALLLVSFRRLSTANPGFDTRGTLTAGMSLSSWKYASRKSRAGFGERLLAKLTALPGVTAAALTYPLPLSGNEWNRSYSCEGEPEPEPGQQWIGDYVVATSDYFSALAIPLRRGRSFTGRDVAGAPKVAVVDESLAARCWPGQQAIGRRLKLDGSPSARAPWIEVVGVVPSVHSAGVDSSPSPTIYVPYAQDPSPDLAVVLRSFHQEAAAGGLRTAITSVDPDQPIYDVRPLAAYLADGQSRSRLALLLLGCFAAAAVCLAGIGTYSVIARSVGERRQEIGVRMALGAEPGQVVALIVKQSARLWLLGIAIGLALALAAAAPLAPLLYRTSPRDPLVLAMVSVGLAASAFLASYLPARRALGVEPVTALKSS